MKSGQKIPLILAVLAIFLLLGAFVVGVTIKENQDEVQIIQNSRSPARLASESVAGRQDPKIQKSEVPKATGESVESVQISGNPTGQENVLGGETMNDGDVDEIGKLSVNTATEEELDTIPGVGAATSQKIIDGRPWMDLEECLKLISTRYRDQAREKVKL